ncbi:hypothetical protein [Actinospica acidithermotolerans]|nr:hypothetical protein [Actinospica acidithermotolerans]
MHWDQAAGLFRRGGAPPGWRLRPKQQPLTARAKATTLAAIALLGALPYAEEMARCLRGTEAGQ